MSLLRNEYGELERTGAEEETRTPTALTATAPSTLRVYQFHHLGPFPWVPSAAADGRHYSERPWALSTGAAALSPGSSIFWRGLDAVPNNPYNDRCHRLCNSR